MGDIRLQHCKIFPAVAGSDWQTDYHMCAITDGKPRPDLERQRHFDEIIAARKTLAHSGDRRMRFQSLGLVATSLMMASHGAHASSMALEDNKLNFMSCEGTTVTARWRGER